MTIKYQRPAGVYSGSSSLSNRSKYQLDSSAQPKVAISSSKMDGDFNYIIDTLNIIDEAAGSQPTIDSRLNVSLNDDGSLKASASSVMDDWIVANLTNITRVDNSTVSFEGNQTNIYNENKRVRLIIAGNNYYATVASSSFAVNITTLNLVDVVDSAGAVAVIATNPSELSYSPLLVGVKGNVPVRFSELEIQEIKSRTNGGLIRFIDSAGSEYAIRSQSNKLQMLENTGSESSPIWVVRGEISSSGFVMVDGSLNGSSLSDNTVTNAKISQVASMNVLGNTTGSSANVAEVNVLDEDDLTSDSATALATQQSIKAYVDNATPPLANNATAGILKTSSSGEVKSANNSARIVTPNVQKFHYGSAKAWVNFNAVGTVSIIESYNVSSVTDNGAGRFTVNFTNAMASSGYAVVGMGGFTSGVDQVANIALDNSTAPSTSAFRLYTTREDTGTASDFDQNMITVFGDM